MRPNKHSNNPVRDCALTAPESYTQKAVDGYTLVICRAHYLGIRDDLGAWKAHSHRWAISNASTERHRKEEELQRGVDHLESEITEIKRELDQITNRLGDIEEAVRPVDIDTDPI